MGSNSPSSFDAHILTHKIAHDQFVAKIDVARHDKLEIARR
jgi:hypothetical protein